MRDYRCIKYLNPFQAGIPDRLIRNYCNREKVPDVIQKRVITIFGQGAKDLRIKINKGGFPITVYFIYDTVNIPVCSKTMKDKT